MGHPANLEKEICLLKRSLWLIVISVCLQAIALIVVVLLVLQR